MKLYFNSREAALLRAQGAWDASCMVEYGTNLVRPERPKRIRPNAYIGYCSWCALEVKRGEGHIEKKPNGKWSTTHLACFKDADVPDGDVQDTLF